MLGCALNHLKQLSLKFHLNHMLRNTIPIYYAENVALLFVLYAGIPEWNTCWCCTGHTCSYFQTYDKEELSKTFWQFHGKRKPEPLGFSSTIERTKQTNKIN